MSTIVTRAGKGSPLTWNEVDSNFTNLNTDKIQSGSTVSSLTITTATINGGSITGITDLAVSDGGTGASTASDARANLLPSYAGNAGKVMAVNSGATDVEYITVGGTGTVTSVSGTGTVNGITLTGTVTASGSLTLGGTLSGIGNSQLTNSSVTVNGTAISLGASGTITAANPNALTISTGLSGTSYTGSSAVTIAIDSTVATLTGSQTLTNKTLTTPAITDPVITGTIQEDVYALTDGSTVDIDPGNGSIQTLTLTSTGRTLTFTNMVAGEAITLMVNDGTAGTITTWNATFVNNSGAAPTLSTTGYTVVSIWKVSTTVYAAVVGNA